MEKFIEALFSSDSPEGAAGNVLKGLFTMLMGSQANKGPSQAQEDAMKRMMQIATGQYNMQAKHANMDLPLRQDLFGALRNREAEKAPRIQPGSFRPSNPYERLNRVGPANPGSLMPSLMGGGKPALGAGFTPQAATRNPMRPPLPAPPVAGSDPMPGRTSGMTVSKPY